jgi:hypothetical protein
MTIFWILVHVLYCERLPEMPRILVLDTPGTEWQTDSIDLSDEIIFEELPEVTDPIELASQEIGIQSEYLNEWLVVQATAGNRSVFDPPTDDPTELVDRIYKLLYPTSVGGENTIDGLWRYFIVAKILVDTKSTGCPKDTTEFDHIRVETSSDIPSRARTFALIAPRCSNLWIHWSHMAAYDDHDLSEAVHQVAELAIEAKASWIDSIMDNTVRDWYLSRWLNIFEVEIERRKRLGIVIP